MGKFSDSVNPRSFKILTQPDYIFLCGGRLDDFNHSLRAHFYRDKVLTNPDLAKRVQLAEKADDWYQSRKLFADLLELEEHLAGLSACILLFVESPGAIAEFGAFSQMKLLLDKLVVVVEDSHFSQTSFIRNGLIEHAKRISPESVLSYPWFLPLTNEIDRAGAVDTLNEVEEEIQEILRRKPKTTTFRANDHGHLMLLVADIVALNIIARQQDIQETINSLDISISSSDLKKYLFLLEKLSHISKFHYGHVDYYLNPLGKPEYVDYAPKTPTDRSRLRALLREDLPLTLDMNKALSAFSRRSGGTP